ncbi:bifunctional diguanylate cyclase/phosphodiesterase [Acuticoccus sediminis]|uniref:bifunctional diguanylate cyclase/phosphodiesterase n=1 Tax=Acuticoccus sediminis TaxID=2184697 RepID=UPI001CFEA61E|nr:EAL domain-containing protein [Acuticoccus sediminis]
MLNLPSCIAFGHDLVLVGLAVVICAIGSVITARLLRRTMESVGRARIAWISIGAIAAGSTIWCTHFVAMLGYEPGVAVTYEPLITIVSLVVAVVGCGAAFGLASERVRYAAPVGGAAFGIAISVMHYSGMMAIAVNGVIEWNAPLVALSIAFAVVFGAVAFLQVKRRRASGAIVAGAAFVSVAIVALHFTGMAALSIYPNPALEGDILINDVARGLIAFAVTGVGLSILAVGAISYFLDEQTRAQYASRLHHLTQSVVDGVAVVSGGRIVDANAELERMTHLTRAELLGRSMSDFLNVNDAMPEGQVLTATLTPAGAAALPVEFALRTEVSTIDATPLTIYSVRDISQRLAQERRILFLAEFDSLTGLRNRASFLDKSASLLHWSADSTRYVMLAVDLDRFKEVNDIHGHSAGDMVLRTAGGRLRELLEPGQIGARFGGDEFVVFSRVSSKDQAVTLAERIEKAFSAAIDYEGAMLQCYASVGVALYPQDGEEINTLLNNADLAMYRAKASGTERICYYDETLDDAIRAQRRMIDEMRHAIANDEFELHYQAQVRLPDEEIDGYEALVRWRHPTRGLVAPNDFIPAAEQTGLIVRLGEWILRTACTEASRWANALPVAVNISPVQLADPHFVSKVKETLRTTGMDPSRLELEVTESCFIGDNPWANPALQELKSLGIAISMDDFGTGYSSLAMLNSFPFDKIKLDKSLIDQVHANPKAKSIVRAVMSLGDALDVPILAEGVEIVEQLDYLRAEGCSLVQGYYYGKPGRLTVADASAGEPSKSDLSGPARPAAAG